MMPRVITDVLVDGRVSMRRLSVFLAEPTMTNAYVRPMSAAGREQNLVLEIRRVVLRFALLRSLLPA